MFVLRFMRINDYSCFYEVHDILGKVANSSIINFSYQFLKIFFKSTLRLMRKVIIFFVIFICLSSLYLYLPIQLQFALAVTVQMLVADFVDYWKHETNILLGGIFIIRKSKDYVYGIWVYKALDIWKGYYRVKKSLVSYMKPWTEARNNKYMKYHSKLTYQLSFWNVSRKVDYHAGGKWFIHGPKRRKEISFVNMWADWDGTKGMWVDHSWPWLWRVGNLGGVGGCTI